MRSITTKQLQRDYGLSYVAAETLIQQQLTRARGHCRRWQTAIFIGVAANLALLFAPDDSLYYRATEFTLPLTCIVLGVIACLVRRRAQAPILAVARAAASAD